MPITAQSILDHRPHVVSGAPHLMVCTCGETFRAVPDQSGPAEAWAVHLASLLTEAVTR